MGQQPESRSWIEGRRRVLRGRLQLLRMLGSAPAGLVTATVLVAVVAGLLPAGLMLAGGSLTARIQGALREGGSAASLAAVYRGFALVLGLFLAGEVIVPVQSRLRWLLMKRVDGAARDRLMRASLAGTDMTHLHDADFLHALRRARGLIAYSVTPGGGAVGLIGLGRDYLTGFAAAAVLWWFQPLIALVAIVVALIVRVRWRAAEIAIINVWIDGLPSFHEARYFVELGLGRPSANEIRLFGLRDWIRQRIHSAGVRGWKPTWRQRSEGFGRQTALHLVLTGIVAVVALVWAARGAVRGSLSVAGLVVFVQALFAVLAIGRVFDDDSAVEYGGFALPALHTIERVAGETVAREGGERVRPPPSGAPPSVELRDVSFAYPGGEEVLRRVDLRIPAGTSAALVGMNGAGKTTLVRLLCGLYPPGRGAVLVDGIDLRRLDLEEWHRRIAPMFQEFLRMPLTVRENVVVGAAERAEDTQALRAAMEEAAAVGFTERLPDGLDTLLSTRHADGSDLSGGQWQRLGVARALFALRAGARLLIMDEPTSNLDTGSEERLVRRLLDQTRGEVTTLLVTHRLALARRTDRIYVLERGRVVEEGTHEDLISLQGRYASAFRMQASLYPLEEAAGG